MGRSGIKLVAALALLLVSSMALAEVKVTVDRNQGDQATSDFKFKKVPSPAKENAARKAKFNVVDGDKDNNSAELDALNDGKLPTEEDQPDSNFFFADDSEGGRISIDLGSVTDIKEINTYSWHPNTRAPQVYTLYGSDGTGADFNAAPKSDVDPTKCGWTKIAKVDTRPKDGDPGGQYGVSITDTNGSIGKYRYLLLVASRTESDDSFGNTFYSEITVVPNGAAAPAPEKAPAPAEADKK